MAENDDERTGESNTMHRASVEYGAHFEPGPEGLDLSLLPTAAAVHWVHFYKGGAVMLSFNQRDGSITGPDGVVMVDGEGKILCTPEELLAALRQVVAFTSQGHVPRGHR